MSDLWEQIVESWKFGGNVSCGGGNSSATGLPPILLVLHIRDFVHVGLEKPRIWPLSYRQNSWWYMIPHPHLKKWHVSYCPRGIQQWAWQGDIEQRKCTAWLWFRRHQSWCCVKRQELPHDSTHISHPILTHPGIKSVDAPSNIAINRMSQFLAKILWMMFNPDPASRRVLAQILLSRATTAQREGRV